MTSPLCISLCHHSHVAIVVQTPAESGTQDVTWLSKSTVPVSMQQEKAFCFITHPHVLNLTVTLDTGASCHFLRNDTVCLQCEGTS